MSSYSSMSIDLCFLTIMRTITLQKQEEQNGLQINIDWINFHGLITPDLGSIRLHFQNIWYIFSKHQQYQQKITGTKCPNESISTFLWMGQKNQESCLNFSLRIPYDNEGIIKSCIFQRIYLIKQIKYNGAEMKEIELGEKNQPIIFKQTKKYLLQDILAFQTIRFIWVIILIKNMGGTTTQPMTNNFVFQKQSAGLQGNSKDLLRQYDQSYQQFVDSLLPKSNSLDLPFLTSSQVLYLETSKFFQKYNGKISQRTNLENFILKIFSQYINKAFYMPLVKELWAAIKNMSQLKSKSYSVGRVRHLLVIGDSGALFRFSYQIAFGFIKEKDEDHENDEENMITKSFYGLFCGISVVNVEGDALINDVLDNVINFLATYHVELNETLKTKFVLLHDINDKDAMKKYNELQQLIKQNGQAPQSSTLMSIGKMAVTIFEILTPIMKVVSTFVQDPPLVKQGADINEYLDNLRAQEKPETNQSPLWRVGLITATYKKQTQGNIEERKVSFTGTVIDDYTILTSVNALLREQKGNPSYTLDRLEIKLPKEGTSKNVKLDMVDLGNDENNCCFLYLQQPVLISYLAHLPFVLKYIKDPSTFHRVQSDKIYMCGHSKNGNQYHQASKALFFDQTHFVEAFQKNESSIGAPIYYFDPEDYSFCLIGLNHSSLSLDDAKIDRKTQSIEVISQFIQRNWFKQALYKRQMAESTFKYKGAQIKEKINNEQRLVLQNQSMLDQYYHGFSTCYSPINSIGIIKIKNNFQVIYGIGILIRQNQFLTLAKYSGDDSKVVTVHIKKFIVAKEKRDIVQYDLSNRLDFDNYWVTGQRTIKGNENLRILTLQAASGTKAIQNITRIIKKDELPYLENMQGFYVGINKLASQGEKIQLKFQGAYYPLQIMQNYTEYYSSSQIESLIFVRQGQQVQYCCGFYEPPKSGKKSEKSNAMYLGGNQTINESIPIRNERRIIEGETRNNKPYKYMAILMSRFKEVGTIRIGTCSLLQSKKDKVFVITCAHNLVYVQDDNVYVVDKSSLDNIKILFEDQKEIKWNAQDIKQRFRNTISIVKDVHIHPKYIENIKAATIKKQLRAQADKKIMPQNFYDVAVLEIELKQDQQQDYIQGFVIRKSPHSINKNNVKDVEIAGFPGYQSEYGSKFGLLYSEVVKYHEQKYHSECYKIISQTNKEQIIHHKLSTLSGNSGSPVFIPVINNEKHILLGIHIAGVYRSSQVFNLASYVYSKEIYSWLTEKVKIKDAIID